MTLTKKEGARMGELRRDAGLFRATIRKNPKTLACELAFLEALWQRPEGITTDDAVDDLAEEFSDGGRWRGSVPQKLARQGLIEKTGYVNSCRPSRHRGPVAVWRVANSEAVKARIKELRTIHAALSGEVSPVKPPAKNTPAQQGSLFQ